MSGQTVGQLQAEGYTHIRCECSCGIKLISFKMLRRSKKYRDEMTVEKLSSEMRCTDCRERPTGAGPWRQEDAKGYSLKS